MKIGDLYTCTRNYIFNGTIYYSKNKLYKICDLENDPLQRESYDHVYFSPVFNDNLDNDGHHIIMFLYEISSYFKPTFKFGR